MTKPQHVQFGKIPAAPAVVVFGKVPPTVDAVASVPGDTAPPHDAPPPPVVPADDDDATGEN